jgi:hypothetical protein
VSDDVKPWKLGDAIGRSAATLDDLWALLYAERSLLGFEALAGLRSGDGASRGPMVSETTSRERDDDGVRQTDRRAWVERREYRTFAIIEPTMDTDIFLSVGYDEENPTPHSRQRIRLSRADAAHLGERLLSAAAGRWSSKPRSDPDAEMEDRLRPRDA